MKQKIDLENYEPIPVAYQLRYGILSKLRKEEDPLPDIQGREETKRDVLIALLSGTNPYLVSEEGTGKTRLARSITRLLPAVPVIKGCPYNDDPKWPKDKLCPRCKSTRDPVRDFGVEILPGIKRFSRVQGNEYTNEAKLLGLKDIQAIAQGKSPSDPSVFTGTGIFRANRGVLFIDELPAIRTKVQVILHPVLEEKKAILEEYNWEHPLDLVLIATGNPQGFAHVNEVPRPLLDRLELIYMDLPDEEVEREIILKEKFRIRKEEDDLALTDGDLRYISLEEIERKTIAPWWIIDLLNLTVRQTRISPFLEKRASIRASIRALDHTYGATEFNRRSVATLKDLATGLRLALRGRVGLRPDLVDFENPKETLRKTDELTEYLLCKSIEAFNFPLDVEREKFSEEMNMLLENDLSKDLLKRIESMREVSKVIKEMILRAKEKITPELNENERRISEDPYTMEEKILEEYTYSALELVVNLAWHRNLIPHVFHEKFFIPRMGGFQRR